MANMYEIPEIVKLIENSGLTHDQKMQAVEALHAARSFGIDEAILMLKGEKKEKA
jgi:hypothetical protein